MGLINDLIRRSPKLDDLVDVFPEKLSTVTAYILLYKHNQL